MDQAFAAALERNSEMQHWLLRGGRFDRFARCSRLLIEEQFSARKGDVNNWWRYWWCRLPDGKESETDLFFVFEAGDYRFAVHIENKPYHGILTIDQASEYRRRATFMANTPRWLDYTDFETILLAPRGFIKTNQRAVGQFDRAISYESAASFVPLFTEAVAHSDP